MSCSTAEPLAPARSSGFYQGLLTEIDAMLRHACITQAEAVIVASQIVALYLHTCPPEARDAQAELTFQLIRDTLKALTLRDQAAQAKDLHAELNATSSLRAVPDGAAQ